MSRILSDIGVFLSLFFAARLVPSNSYTIWAGKLRKYIINVSVFITFMSSKLSMPVISFSQRYLSQYKSVVSSLAGSFLSRPLPGWQIRKILNFIFLVIVSFSCKLSKPWIASSSHYIGLMVPSWFSTLLSTAGLAN
jgi:hypothetical protein